MDSEYIYEEFDRSHYVKFNLLYRNAFKKSMPFREFWNRFDTQSLGKEFIGFIATHRETGTPASFYGVFPLKMRNGHSIISAAVSGDTMTHSQFRRRGLFQTLAKMTFDKCLNMDIKLIYGFPNSQSYHGLVHNLGWKHLNDLTEWTLDLYPGISPVPRIITYFKFIRPLFISYALLLLKDFIVTNIQSFNTPFASRYSVVDRNRDYLTYKWNGDKMFLEICGTVVWIRLSRFLWVGDFSNLENLKPEVIKQLKKFGRLMGYNSIRFAVNNEITLPYAMKDFRATQKYPTCILYFDNVNKFLPPLFTPADFDTW